MDAIAESPVRAFFEHLESLGPGDAANLLAIGSALAEFAQDAEFWEHHIAALGERSGARPIHTPDRGPRLQMVHRLEGQMGAIHSHKVWVALAPVTGTETHRRYSGERQGKIEVAETRHLNPGEMLTLIPPEDIHDHGHMPGYGAAAYVLILTGDNQLAFEREEYDAATGSMRVLAPGDPGKWVAG